MAGKATFVKAKVDDATDAASTLGVMGLPTVVIFRDGKEVDRMTGAGPLATILKKVEKITG